MKTLSTLALVLVSLVVFAQKKPFDAIASVISEREAEAHMQFLASDEMRGRDTGSPELNIAANYISSYLKQLGLNPAPGTTNYFQEVPLQKTRPASTIEFKLKNEVFKAKEHLVELAGGNISAEADVVFAGYGTQEELSKLDVKGKIVVVNVGEPKENNMAKAIFADAPAKNERLSKAGAVALIEIVTIAGVPFEGIANYFSSPRVSIRREGTIPQLWMKNSDAPALIELKDKKQGRASLNISGSESTSLNSRNVAAVVEGTDQKLKNEYIVISSHYDHVGVGRKNDANDSIFNGARDNAIGTVGMMLTAKYLSQNKPKRSVMFLALTAEEQGLLGSAYYAEKPLIPLKQTVFNFNCDGAGYNDKTIATIIGLERTTAEADIVKACEAFGLKAIKDPVPEQNLYERSDNYSFAVKGIPAIDFAPGIKAFDEELFRYYHNQEDEVASLDFSYLMKYFRSYVYANVLLANASAAPKWKSGDKFEPASKALYGN